MYSSVYALINFCVLLRYPFLLCCFKCHVWYFQFFLCWFLPSAFNSSLLTWISNLLHKVFFLFVLTIGEKVLEVPVNLWFIVLVITFCIQMFFRSSIILSWRVSVSSRKACLGYFFSRIEYKSHWILLCYRFFSVYIWPLWKVKHLWFCCYSSFGEGVDYLFFFGGSKSRRRHLWSWPSLIGSKDVFVKDRFLACC